MPESGDLVLGFVYFLLAVAACLAVWNLISPRSAWRALIAWQHRDPEAHEPSETAYTVNRVVSVVALVLAAVVAGITTQGVQAASSPEAEYQACLEKNSSWDDEGGLLTSEDVCEDKRPD